MNASQDAKKSKFRIETLEERIAPAIVLQNPGGNTPRAAERITGRRSRP